LASLLLSSCAKTTPLRLRLANDVQRPDKSVVILFVDGMDHRTFTRLLYEGRLPRIGRRFLGQGVTVERAVTSIPAMTYPNTVTLMTGRFPGHHHIVGNQWFDRRTLGRPDYITAEGYRTVNHDFRWPTLYEVLPEYFSVNALGTVYRGVTQNVDYENVEGVGWFLGLFTNVDELSAGCLEDVGDLANRVKRWPSLLTFYFPGVDETGHLFGSDSQAYANALVSVDVQIGRILDAIDGAGLAGQTYFVLVTDHGHAPTRSAHSIDLHRWLRKHRRLNIHDGALAGGDYGDRLAHLNRHDALIVNGSYRRIAIHLRGAAGWMNPPAAEDINRVVGHAGTEGRLCDVPGIGLLALRNGPSSVRILSRRGEALVRRRSDAAGVTYCLEPLRAGVNADGDPLGYCQAPETRSFVEAGWHSSREWLAATAGTKYPDFVPQIVEYFDSARAGDILAFADEGWAFSNHKLGEHGSALADDMLIPMFFAGPDLPQGGRISTARLVDVMPTVVDLLGESRRLKEIPPIDGISLLPQLRDAAPPSAP
jgi:arylsulfatase A-like enzyme